MKHPFSTPLLLLTLATSAAGHAETATAEGHYVRNGFEPQFSKMGQMHASLA